MKMGYEPLLSVIMPVYNAGSYFHRCIESILSQSYRKFELVLVDDGSTDGSAVLCDEYARRDSRIIVVHTENSGPYQARKLGVKMSKGEMLAFSDADDWLERNALETAMRLFLKYNPDMLAYIYACGEGKIEKHLYKEGLYSGEEIGDKIIPGMMYDFACGGRRLNPSLCCKLIKKELFVKVTESVMDRITLGEDALVTYPAVCLAESIFICNRVLYHYSTNDGSCTHAHSLDKIMELKAFQDNIMRLFIELGMLDKMKWQVENYVRSFLAVLIRDWYGMELSPVMFCFPYNYIPKGSNVLVYGAGDVGRSYINDLKLSNYAEIAGWVDKKYNRIERYSDTEIIAPEQIGEHEFDVLLIAVYDEKVSKEITKDLVNMGVDAEKIFWTKPLRII